MICITTFKFRYILLLYYLQKEKLFTNFYEHYKIVRFVQIKYNNLQMHCSTDFNITLNYSITI